MDSKEYPDRLGAAVSAPDLATLVNEFTFQKYRMDRVNLRKYFEDLSIVEYIIMYLAKAAKDSGTDEGRVYLEQAARQLQMPIYGVSKTAGILRDRGLVSWTHDGDGSEGTYLVITEAGEKTLEKQGEALRNFYARVIARFGKERLAGMLGMMREFDGILEEEMGERKERLHD